MKEEPSLPVADTEHLKMALRPSSVLQAFIVGLTLYFRLVLWLNLATCGIHTSKWHLRHLLKAVTVTPVGITSPILEDVVR